VQVHCDEGVAIRIGPEPCVGGREAAGEASAGDRIGQPLSRERVSSRVPTQYAARKATRLGALCERLIDPAWSKTLACADASCAGTGRSHGRPEAACRAGPCREGEEP
jgi:hypothetical protein